MSINIRKAESSDLSTVQQFGYELLEYERVNWDPALDPSWPFSEEGRQKYERAINDRYVLIAEDEGKPVGFLIATLSEAVPGSARNISTAQLNNIYIREEKRGHGIGEQLCDEFLKYCQEKTIDKISVTVNSRNKHAIEFYEKMGFSPSLHILSIER